MFFARWLLVAMLLALPLLGGCSCLGGATGGSAIPPTETPQQAGLLLRTGAIQLGHGLGDNAYAWQGGAGPRF